MRTLQEANQVVGKLVNYGLNMLNDFHIFHFAHDFIYNALKGDAASISFPR